MSAAGSSHDEFDSEYYTQPWTEGEDLTCTQEQQLRTDPRFKECVITKSNHIRIAHVLSTGEANARMSDIRNWLGDSEWSVHSRLNMIPMAHHFHDWFERKTFPDTFMLLPSVEVMSDLAQKLNNFATARRSGENPPRQSYQALCPGTEWEYTFFPMRINEPFIRFPDVIQCHERVLWQRPNPQGGPPERRVVSRLWTYPSTQPPDTEMERSDSEGWQVELRWWTFPDMPVLRLRIHPFFAMWDAASKLQSMPLAATHLIPEWKDLQLPLSAFATTVYYRPYPRIVGETDESQTENGDDDQGGYGGRWRGRRSRGPRRGSRKRRRGGGDGSGTDSGPSRRRTRTEGLRERPQEEEVAQDGRVDKADDDRDRDMDGLPEVVTPDDGIDESDWAGSEGGFDSEEEDLTTGPPSTMDQSQESPNPVIADNLGTRPPRLGVPFKRRIRPWRKSVYEANAASTMPREDDGDGM
ncbi:hypothetical protein BOTBODRAFT_508523 [Botryobasidium botryosum FD-172 SS1]|uniref:Uncharacterized protein n=1 Tax=Botryobasidium botryosum (strain FD-172 SS1) TaxID=930990 RepID=A0A067MUB3_BOTB1|nr:hypothetical protein BOTBODRAFT_508523 [Botryobasidium botryosum FD-172 SS1]